MRQITSQFLRTNFGEVLRLARTEPIVVIKAQRARAVIISPTEYADLVFLRGLHWLVTGQAGMDAVHPGGGEASWREMIERLQALAECTQQPVSGMIRVAIEEKVEEGEEALAVQAALQEPGKRWTLSELLTGKDLRRHELRG